MTIEYLYAKIGIVKVIFIIFGKHFQKQAQVCENMSQKMKQIFKTQKRGSETRAEPESNLLFKNHLFRILASVRVKYEWKGGRF